MLKGKTYLPREKTLEISVKTIVRTVSTVVEIASMKGSGLYYRDTKAKSSARRAEGGNLMKDRSIPEREMKPLRLGRVEQLLPPLLLKREARKSGART